MEEKRPDNGSGAVKAKCGIVDSGSMTETGWVVGFEGDGWLWGGPV